MYWSDNDVPDGELDPDIQDILMEWRKHVAIPSEWLVLALLLLSWVGLLSILLWWLDTCQRHGGHLVATGNWFKCAA